MELFIMAIAYLFGILSGLYFRISIVFFLLASFIIYFFRNKNKLIKFFCLKQYIILFVIAYIVSFIQITYLENSFKTKYANVKEEINVIGTIVSNGTNKQYSTNYILQIESINGNKSYKNTKLLLKIKKEKKEISFSYGNKISLTGIFEKPSMQRNEGGFDYSKYLKTKQIYGIITANSSTIVVKKENNSTPLLKTANMVSCKIEQKANTLLEKQEASLLTGILIGNKENLEEEVQKAFQKSNLSHMLAVSGAHVSYIMLGITYFMAISKIGKKKSKIVTIFILLFFILITGQTSSVTRACFMVIYLIFASLLYKKVPTISSISISMLIIMALNPYSILDIGFQLSYGGTLGIVIFNKTLKQCFIKGKQEDIKKHKLIRKIKQNVKEILLTTISANLILIPIMLYHYNTLSLVFIISNLLASPIMGILVVLGFLTILISFFLPFIAKFLAIPLKLLLKIFLQIAVFTSKLPFCQIKVITPKISWIILYYCILGIFIVCQNRKNKRKRKFEKKLLEEFKKITRKKKIVIFIIFVLFIFICKQIPKPLKIHFIDVGQGDSMLIVTPHGKTILIDGGGSKDNENFDVGENTLIPYLLDKGIAKLDYVLISHFDADHVGGILTLLNELKVEKVIISMQGENSQNYESFKKIVKKKKIKVIIVKMFDKITIEKNVIFQILWPQKEQIKENILNNNSIVAKLIYNSFSMLLTGDIEKIAEEKIIEEYKNTNILKASLLKVAHHGSKSSSTQEFLEQVKPKIALIGVGETNTFGHPNETVIKRLQSLRYKSV